MKRVLSLGKVPLFAELAPWDLNTVAQRKISTRTVS
jgi:hypothetical protein